jgi:cation:H+ antiporter
MGNIIGSNIFNLLVILGCCSMLSPIAVPIGIVNGDAWWMLGLTVLILPLMLMGRRINRWEGGVLFMAYALYLGLLLGSTQA